MENKTPFTVDDVARRIVATQEELQTIESALAVLPAKKEALLSAETFEEAALSQLEEEESSLTRKREYLKRRLPVLEKHREAEEAKAAQERITAVLVAETHALREKYDATLTSFWKSATALENTANKLVDLYKEIQTRHDEQEYVLERYAAFGLQRTTLSDVGEVPHPEEVAKQIFQTLRLLRLSWESDSGKSPWSRKLTELHKECFKNIAFQIPPVRNVA